MQKEYKIIFTQETTPIVSEIIQKFGLKDIGEDFLDKLEKGETLVIPGAVILDLAIKKAIGEISEERMVSLLEEYLDITEKTAKLLAADIETKLLSITKKILKSDIAKKESKIISEELRVPKDFTQIKPPIGIPQMGEMYKPKIPEKRIDEKFIEKLKKPSRETPKEIKKINKKSIKSKKTTKKESDSYREPIT